MSEAPLEPSAPLHALAMRGERRDSGEMVGSREDMDQTRREAG
jgi:hypothetical protein